MQQVVKTDCLVVLDELVRGPRLLATLQRLLGRRPPQPVRTRRVAHVQHGLLVLRVLNVQLLRVLKYLTVHSVAAAFQGGFLFIVGHNRGLPVSAGGVRRLHSPPPAEQVGGGVPLIGARVLLGHPREYERGHLLLRALPLTRLDVPPIQRSQLILGLRRWWDRIRYFKQLAVVSVDPGGRVRGRALVVLLFH